MSRIVALIPGRERIRESFAYEVDLSYVPLPSLLAEDLAEAERMAEIVKKIGRITRYETKEYVGSASILDLDKSASSSGSFDGMKSAEDAETNE